MTWYKFVLLSNWTYLFDTSWNIFCWSVRKSFFVHLYHNWWRVHSVPLYCHANANKSLDVSAKFFQKAGRIRYANISNSLYSWMMMFGFLYPWNVHWSCKYSIWPFKCWILERKMSEAQSEYYDTQIRRYSSFNFHRKHYDSIFKIKTKISKQFSRLCFVALYWGGWYQQCVRSRIFCAKGEFSIL